MLWGVGLVSLVSTTVVAYLLVTRFSGFALDEPNARSLHERPVPRTGGLAVLAGIAVATIAFASGLWLTLGLALLLAVVSLIDDVRALPTLARLGAHLAAAGVLAWYVLSPMHPLELLIIVLALGWITNLYNFMDGSDGLAAGMALIGFGAYGFAASVAGKPVLAATSLAVAGAALGFVFFNFYPARIFLGDVGSIPLGFLAGTLGLIGWHDDGWQLWFPLVVFAPFIGDATLTLLKRALRGERIWQAHREHYYQRLVRMGLGHRGVALIGYAAMLACAGAALFGRDQAPWLQAMVFGAMSVALAAAAVLVDVRWSRFIAQQGDGE
jgi:UDP-N-acetylmuramyl pentapeptide phosphotransferase/UDP-N-acetylglucosamine-1-phosphate transferase